MKVRFSKAAETDLESIGDYIARDSPRRALTYTQELRRTAQNLVDLPHKFPLVPRYQHSGIRRRPYGDYLIFYVVGPKDIAIVRIVHGARDYEAILFPPSEP